jgi:hypothetical protein
MMATACQAWEWDQRLPAAPPRLPRDNPGSSPPPSLANYSHARYSVNEKNSWSSLFFEIPLAEMPILLLLAEKPSVAA